MNQMKLLIFQAAAKEHVIYVRMLNDMLMKVLLQFSITAIWQYTISFAVVLWKTNTRAGTRRCYLNEQIKTTRK